jgi:hypothetical protein
MLYACSGPDRYDRRTSDVPLLPASSRELFDSVPYLSRLAEDRP